MTKCAFIFPGQGAQKVQMGKDFYDNFSSAKEVFLLADEILKQNYSQFIFSSDAKQLAFTQHSQLSIFITSIAILTVIQSQFKNINPIVCGGLSLGEYSALVGAKKAAFEHLLSVVKSRGEYMQQASIEHPGGMSAILGLDEDALHHILKQHNALEKNIWIANLNSPGQVVIAGDKEKIALMASPLKEAGAKRIIPLDVSGAFHSGFMQSAQEKLAPLIANLPLSESPIGFVSNVSGAQETNLDVIKELLIKQVTQPVRWEDCVRSMEQMQVDTYIEMGPSKTLAGMNKKIKIKGNTVSVETVQDLEKLGEIFS